MATTKTFISSVGAKSQGRYSYYKMLSEARQGDLVKVKRGVYMECVWLDHSHSTGLSCGCQEGKKGNATGLPGH